MRVTPRANRDAGSKTGRIEQYEYKRLYNRKSYRCCDEGITLVHVFRMLL
jgi:hypothetical protein